MSILSTDIEFIKGVGPKRAEVLRTELGVRTVKDLLQIYPFRYIDKTKFQTIREVRSSGDIMLLKGKIASIQKVKGKNNRTRLTAILKDGTGFLELVWFQSIKWVENSIVEGKEYTVYGRITNYGGKKGIAHPEIEEFRQDIKLHQALDPVYSSTDKLDKSGLDSKGRRKILKAIFAKLQPQDIGENLPEEVVNRYKLVDRYKALCWIHFPQMMEQKNLATNRIKFEEFFFVQIQLIGSKTKRKQVLKGAAIETIGEKFNTFFHNHLKFELTNAQKKVLREIRADMGAGYQMNRLLQGDVGSGKTVVGLMSMLMAIDNGYQTSLIAPTEILAQQHYIGISELLDGLDIKVAFLSGSVKGKKRKKVLEDLESGELDILIGTHAVIEPTVIFHKLGLAIIDEQHRFGVAQRARMWRKNKGVAPHILVMTATPIPRTLSMTLYGDLDISIIDELPPGRKEVKTVHKFESFRPNLIQFMHKELAKGRQIYIVYPLIEESANLDLKDLQEGYERLLQYFPMPDYQISVVHGRMKAKEKDAEMQRFVEHKTQIMVATTVIEVGVNVPNASIMVIENSERFGLSQLHQLRGRVGRGAEQSFCILMSSYKLSKEAKERLNTMVSTNNGFVIAEADLKLRGPGDIEGTRQSGVINFKLLNLAHDRVIMNAARSSAEEILDQDPTLSLPQHLRLKNYLQIISPDNKDWSRIS